jgi:hypothetical protein
MLRGRLDLDIRNMRYQDNPVTHLHLRMGHNVSSPAVQRQLALKTATS